MKPSEIIIKKFIGGDTTQERKEINLDMFADVIDQMAEDIKYLKAKSDCSFPIMFPESKKREWENE